jgi:hypothetical protein
VRAPKSGMRGSNGQSAVKSQFEQLGWGVAPNLEHDLGTDLWLMPRDKRGFDRLTVVGAQIKTGESYFREQKIENGCEIGWWYRESDDAHFDYWCDHAVPHFLILHSPESRTSYWVEITRDKLVSTGKGSKILVMNSSTIDEEHFDQLLEVGTSLRESSGWEGSIWGLNTAISPSATLRHSFITPRLVAPHPNATEENLSASQAIALLIQVRQSGLRKYQKIQPFTDPAAARIASDWVWNLYAALDNWMYHDDIEELKHVAAQADSPAHKTAAAVALSNAHFEAGRAAESLSVIFEALDADDMDPVDYAWLEAQRARYLYENGNNSGAREAALKVQSMAGIATKDPTASAIVGSSAYILFASSGITEESLATLIQGRDNFASWWRSQVLSEGLADHLRESFKESTQDRSVTIKSEDSSASRLRSTMLLAAFAADSQTWRYSASLLGRYLYMTGDEKKIDTALTLLRLSGEKDSIRLAAEQLRDSGPLRPLKEAAEGINFDRTTRTSLKSDLTLITTSADILSEETRDSHLEWCLKKFNDLEAISEPLGQDFSLRDEILGALTALYSSANDKNQSNVREHVLRSPLVAERVLSGRYARLMRAIGTDSWTQAEIGELARRRDVDNLEVGLEVQNVLAAREPKYREELLERIKQGDFHALVAFGNVSELPLEAASGMLNQLAQRSAEQLEKARLGSTNIGGFNYLDILVQLNLLFPKLANWAPLEVALADVATPANHIADALRRLGNYGDQVPQNVKARLRPMLEVLALRPPTGKPHFSFGEELDARGPSSLSLAMLYPAEITDLEIAKLLIGELGQRVSAVEIIVSRYDERQLCLLAALAHDSNIEVRQIAVRGLAAWLANGICVDPVGELLLELLSQPGVAIGLAVCQGLSTGKAPMEILEALADNPSSVVRKWASEIADKGE